MDDIAKLPKWARSRIAILESLVATLGKQVAQIEGKEATNTFILAGIDEPRPIPARHGVRFVLLGGKSLDVRVKGRRLDLNGEGAVSIHPVASNCFQVEVKDGF